MYKNVKKVISILVVLLSTQTFAFDLSSTGPAGRTIKYTQNAESGQISFQECTIAGACGQRLHNRDFSKVEVSTALNQIAIDLAKNQSKRNFKITTTADIIMCGIGASLIVSGAGAVLGIVYCAGSLAFIHLTAWGAKYSSSVVMGEITKGLTSGRRVAVSPLEEKAMYDLLEAYLPL
jgi:hypothetical protein